MPKLDLHELAYRKGCDVAPARLGDCWLLIGPDGAAVEVDGWTALSETTIRRILLRMPDAIRDRPAA
jgi:hypothetical protein